MKSMQKNKQLGQGMTEYIIIVALIAIAAITVYNLFGDTVRGQVGTMAAELGGQDSSAAEGAATGAASTANTAGTDDASLSDFTSDE